MAVISISKNRFNLLCFAWVMYVYPCAVVRSQLTRINDVYYVLYQGQVQAQQTVVACGDGYPAAGLATIDESILAEIHAFYQRSSSHEAGNSYAWLIDTCPSTCPQSHARWEQNYPPPTLYAGIPYTQISHVALGKRSGRLRDFSFNDTLVTEVLCQFDNICDEYDTHVTCPANGVCLQQTANTDYACICEHDYTGAECEDRLDNCPAGACENGGSCVEESSDYSCDCAAGFTGTHCETNVDDCSGVNCNLGRCLDRIDTFYCDCHGTNGTGEFCLEGSVGLSSPTAASTAQSLTTATAVATTATEATTTSATTTPSSTTTTTTTATATATTATTPATTTPNTRTRLSDATTPQDRSDDHDVNTTSSSPTTAVPGNNNTASAATGSGFDGAPLYTAIGVSLVMSLSLFAVIIKFCRPNKTNQDGGGDSYDEYAPSAGDVSNASTQTYEESSAPTMAWSGDQLDYEDYSDSPAYAYSST